VENGIAVTATCVCASRSFRSVLAWLVRYVGNGLQVSRLPPPPLPRMLTRLSSM
jgi:hypothetical protein